MPGKLMMSSRTGFGVVALVGARDYGVRGFAGWHDFAPDAAVDNGFAGERDLWCKEMSDAGESCRRRQSQSWKVVEWFGTRIELH